MPESNIGQPETPKAPTGGFMEQIVDGAKSAVVEGTYRTIEGAANVFGNIEDGIAGVKEIFFGPDNNAGAESLPVVDIADAKAAKGANAGTALAEPLNTETKSPTSLPRLEVGNEKAEGRPAITPLDTAEKGGKSASLGTKMPLNEASILETYRQAIINPEPAVFDFVTPEVKGVTVSGLSGATKASIPGLRQITRAEEAKRIQSPEERLKSQIEMHEVHRVKSVHTSGWAEGFGTGVVVAIPLTWAAMNYLNSKEQHAIKSNRTPNRATYGGTDK